MAKKTPEQSKTTMTDLVLPSETNPLNNLFGGELLARMDRAASIAARRHSRRIVVTASVNHVAFNRAVPLGSVVTVEAKVSRAFKTSMEVFLDVWIVCQICHCWSFCKCRCRYITNQIIFFRCCIAGF